MFGLLDFSFTVACNMYTLCSHLDRSFVKTEIVEYLENEFGFTLCVHERDFLAGDTIPANIDAAVDHSRRMILVLSK